MVSPLPPPWLPILTTAFVHHLNLHHGAQRRRKAQSSLPDAGYSGVDEKKCNERLPPPPLTLRDVLLCAALLLPPRFTSSAPLLRPLSKILSAWPNLLPASARQRLLPEWLAGRSGPFGRGCLKGCEAACVYALLSLRQPAGSKGEVPRSFPSVQIRMWPPPDALRLGPTPGPAAVFTVLLLSGAVNVVLHVWSGHRRCRGDHDGVNAMVDETVGRSLLWREHVRLAAFAVGNAVCEEIVSRGFFYHQLVGAGGMSPREANLAQAVAFGLWHYHGIPSGWTGVGLTFVYGWIMGALMMHGDGLLLPILAHSLADYFIFAVIARQQFDPSSRLSTKQR